jgi:16S rRNA U516 pseudouridylate synthase RsuA-like enzyme
MNKSSKAFGEYVARRCEEILQDDEKNKKLSNKIIVMEEELKKTLNCEQIIMYNKIEGMACDLKSNNENLLYLNGFNDRVSILTD